MYNSQEYENGGKIQTNKLMMNRRSFKKWEELEIRVTVAKTDLLHER